MKCMKKIYKDECKSILHVFGLLAPPQQKCLSSRTVVILGWCTCFSKQASILHRHWQHYMYDNTAELESARATSEDPIQQSSASYVPDTQTGLQTPGNKFYVAITKLFLVTGISNALGTWKETSAMTTFGLGLKMFFGVHPWALQILIRYHLTLRWISGG